MQKKRQTSLEKYGSEYWNQNPELVKQFKDSYQNSVNIRNETNLERYGTINPNSLDEVKAKVRETNLSRYGVEFADFAQIEQYGTKVYFAAFAQVGIHRVPLSCCRCLQDGAPSRLRV